MRVALALLLLAGCGRVDFDRLRDAGGDAEPLGTFTAFRAIPALASSFQEDDPAVSADGLELYWASRRTGLSKIWVARRASRSDEWGSPEQVLELDASADDKAPELSADGLTLYMIESVRIAMSTRPTRASPWSTPQVILDPGFTLGTPAVCESGLVLYMRTNASAPTEDIAVSERATTTDPWPTPVVVPELSSALDDSGPWVSGDCNRIYFDSARTSSGRAYMADRDLQTGLFGAPIELPEIRAAFGAAHDLSLTEDQRYVVFAHNPATVNQIYEASR